MDYYEEIHFTYSYDKALSYSQDQQMTTHVRQKNLTQTNTQINGSAEHVSFSG